MMLLIFVWADFVADLVCSADMLIVIPAGASVDVLSDNAVHFSVLPPTTPPRHYGRCAHSLYARTLTGPPRCARQHRHPSSVPGRSSNAENKPAPDLPMRGR